MGGLSREGVVICVHTDSGVDSTVEMAEYTEPLEEERAWPGLKGMSRREVSKGA